jgi:hypothetical protein
LQYERRQFSQAGKPFIAVMLAGLILLLGAMAASPALHELIHHDAGQAEHQCAVTLFTHGSVDSATVDIPMTLPLTWIEKAASVEFSVFRPAIENLPAGRAPPAAASSPV